MKPIYSIIIPVFNSAKTLEELTDRIVKTFSDIGSEIELILIEDGGKDNSWEIIQAIKLKYPVIVTGVRLTKNYGQHNAIFCGLRYCKGDFVVTIDDDLQLLPEEIPLLIKKQKETNADLVYGIFTKKQHSLYRKAGSAYMKKAGKLVSKTPGKGSSFRIFKSELAEKLLDHHQNFVYLDELLLWYTDHIEFTPVSHHKRKESKSGYSPLKLVKLAFNITIYYTTVPLRMMVIGGFITSIITFLIGVFFIYKNYF